MFQILRLERKKMNLLFRNIVLSDGKRSKFFEGWIDMQKLGFLKTNYRYELSRKETYKIKDLQLHI